MDFDSLRSRRDLVFLDNSGLGGDQVLRVQQATWRTSELRVSCTLVTKIHVSVRTFFVANVMPRPSADRLPRRGDVPGDGAQQHDRRLAGGRGAEALRGRGEAHNQTKDIQGLSRRRRCKTFYFCRHVKVFSYVNHFRSGSVLPLGWLQLKCRDCKDDP